MRERQSEKGRVQRGDKKTAHRHTPYGTLKDPEKMLKMLQQQQQQQLSALNLLSRTS